MSAHDAEPSYRVSDLDGCQVLTEDGELLGILKDVLPTPVHDIFSVMNGEREYLVPARKEVVLSIDTAAKRIVVRLPSGLREMYENL